MKTFLQGFKDNMAKTLFNQPLDEAHARNICIKCSAPIDTSEWSALDVDEYLISGFCPDCFNALSDRIEQEDQDNVSL